MDAYNNYSPLYLPATLAMTYLLAFTLSTCVLVHTLLYHGRTLINGFKRMQVEKDDIHAKLMRSYPEVPDWWYGIAFVTFFSCAIIAMEVWKTGVPVWALLLAVLLPVVYVLPSGFIYAMTGQSVSITIYHFTTRDLTVDTTHRSRSISSPKLFPAHCCLETLWQIWLVAYLVATPTHH